MKLIAVDLLAEKLVMSENETEAVLGLLDFSSTYLCCRRQGRQCFRNWSYYRGIWRKRQCRRLK